MIRVCRHGVIDSNTMMMLANLNADPTTRANYLQIASTHVAFDWHVDFDRRIIQGSATHSLTVQKDAVQEVMYVVAWARVDPRTSLNEGLRIQIRHVVFGHREGRG